MDSLLVKYYKPLKMALLEGLTNSRAAGNGSVKYENKKS
jgi:hypothetical protein